MIGAVLNNRYRLDAELGHGGMGVVYRGHDLLLDRDAAVKLLNRAGLTPEGRTRLLREAQAVAKLNHPNIVTLYDAGEAGDVTYIVMELLSGHSLYERKPANMDELLQVARQVCAALEHAHEHGIIHRDLKPENVILIGQRPGGAAGAAGGDLRVKLTDFGLARSITSRQTTEGGMVGTVFYLPPEQAMGSELDGRADLYSLGVMLYELAAGRLPFAGDDPLTVISQHLHAPAVPPSTYNPGLSSALESLILKLLSKQPEDRPASAAEVGHILERIARKSTDLMLAALESAEPSPLERLVRGRLVGRDSELAEARAIWQRATAEPDADTPHVLLIAGESGVGKTPFVRALRALAEVSRGRWLQGECYAEGGTPYAAFDQAFAAAFTYPTLRASVPRWITSELVRIAPSLRSQVPDLPVDPSKADPSRLVESVVAACEAIIDTGRGRNPPPSPLMLVIEDAQWADSAALALMRSLARRARSGRLKLLIVLTFRESELSEAPGIRDLVLDLTRERLASRIRLEPFDRDHTGDLLHVMFQQEIPPSFVNHIYHQTEGNLFYIEEVCKTLIEEGTLRRADSGWEFPSALCCEALPQSVRLMVQARISKLSPATQDVLRFGAVTGREFAFDTLQRAAGMPESMLVDALDDAQRAQLIMEVEDVPGRAQGQEVFRFAHTLVVATLRDSISGIRRRRMHRQVGEAIEALCPEDHASLAYHYTQAGDDTRARAHLRLAGDAAQRAYANDAAVEAYTQALALTQDASAERFDIFLARVETYNLLGRRFEQRADIQELLVLAERLNDDSRRFEALLAQAEYEIDTQQLHAREPAQRAVEIARRLGDKAREGRALICLGMDARLHGNLERSRPALELAADRLREVGLIAEAASCLQTLSLTLGDLAEFGPALAAAEEAVRLSRQLGDKRREAVSLRRVAIACMEQNQFLEALPYAESALELHREVGERVQECHAHNVLGIANAYLGRGSEAEAHWRSGLPLAEATETSVGGLYCLENMAVLHFAARGEYLAGIALIEEQLTRPYLGENAYAATMLRFRIAQFNHTLGLYERALSVMPEVIDEARRLVSQGIITNGLLAVLVAAHGAMLAGAGRPEEARQDLAEALQTTLAEKWVLQHGDAILTWARGVLLVPTDELLRQALELALTALNRFGKAAPWNFDAGAAHLVLAQLRLALGESGNALEHARKALAFQNARHHDVECFHYTLARALHENGCAAEAADAMRAAYQRVLLVAARTPDPEAQFAWLERVPVNRAIINWWEALNQPGAPPTATTP